MARRYRYSFTKKKEAKKGKLSAGLAASIFHFGEVAIPDLKAELRRNGVCVRL